MTILNTQPSLDRDERARKRAAIGLAPHRPTAKAQPLRPPRPTGGRGCLWSFVALLLALTITTCLLIIARFANSPMDWPSVHTDLRAWLPGVNMPAEDRDSLITVPVAGAYRLVIDEDFKTANGILAPNVQESQWSLAALPDEGVYRMQVGANRLAWSTIGAVALEDFSLESSMTVADVAPAGYAGLIARYRNPQNFYLFAVDGQGRWQVQLLKDGALQTLVPWQVAGSLSPAGTSNLLALEDDRQVLRLYLNGEVVYELADSALPPGDAGVFGAAPADTMAQIDVDWLRLYIWAEG